MAPTAVGVLFDQIQMIQFRWTWPARDRAKASYAPYHPGLWTVDVATWCTKGTGNSQLPLVFDLWS
jgi:hypothetical protein